MSELIKVRRKSQVTLPKSVRRALNIEEGDFLDVKVQDKEIVLRVKKLIDKDQSWFWSKRWQDGEGEAEADIRAGRVHSFESVDEGINFLHSRAKNAREKTA